MYTNPQFTPGEYDAIYQRAPQEPEGVVDFREAEHLRFSRLAKMVRQYTKPGAYLDLGCGAGGFLDVMNTSYGRGFDVGQSGMRKSRNGFEIETGNFFDLQDKARFTDGAYSFVTAFDVFEHLPDLPLYLEQLHRMIQVDGHLVVTVPNVDSMAAKMTGEHWNMILLEHLWYFSPKTLRRILERHGFAHVATSTMPYEAPLSHFFNRLSQTYQLSEITLPKWMASFTISVPIGLMAAVFRRI